MTDQERKKLIAEDVIVELKKRAFGGTFEDYLKKVREQLGRYGYDFDNEVKSFIHDELKKYDGEVLSLDDFSSIPFRHSLWLLTETLERASNNYWNVYKENVKKYLQLDEEDVRELRDVGLDIVNRLIPPACDYDEARGSEYRKKGLVYGNVQSGKTASMGAVISQYATMGCDLIIVLSGIHNNLWEQTQNRLRRDLDVDGQGGSEGLSWRLITAASDSIPPKAMTLFSDVAGKNNRVLGVFKKNSKVLEKLLANYLMETTPGMDRSYLRNTNVLIIDDECDQAGVDVSPEDQEERSKINRCLVRLFSFFPRYSYIGYTATPFANVLNEEPGELSMYPSDFITMLPEKKDYFSATKIFGLGEEFDTYKEYDDPHMNVVQQFKTVQKDGIDDKAISDALLYFVMATAVKRLRAGYLQDDRLLKSHSTMMIHTSGKIKDHRKALEKVQGIIRNLEKEWNAPGIRRNMRRIWEDVYLEKRRLNLEAVGQLFGTSVDDLYIPKSFEEIFDEAGYVFSKIELKIDNSEADPILERLYYDDPEVKTDYFVAVGGNTLSRGLTLEGLIVAVFARKARTYDTLLQMGRWFGYRKRYEDLVRLWLTEEAEEKMRFLAGVELDLRDTIEQYKHEETPLTLAVAVRTRPHMQIVRELAMKAAKPASINYVGRHPQTIYFENDAGWLQNNIDVTKALIRANIGRTPVPVYDGFLFENVSSSSVSDFLREYLFDRNTNGLSSELLLDFKEKAEQSGYIDSWNLVVKTRSDGKHGDDSIIPGQRVGLLERGKIKGNPGRLYLKAIASPWDIVCDIPDGPPKVREMKNSEKFGFRNEYFRRRNQKVPGLLVIYPMYRAGRSHSKDRDDLDAKNDVYGVSIIFPSLSHSSEFYRSVSIRLKDVREIEKEDYAED